MESWQKRLEKALYKNHQAYSYLQAYIETLESSIASAVFSKLGEDVCFIAKGQKFDLMTVKASIDFGDLDEYYENGDEKKVTISLHFLIEDKNLSDELKEKRTQARRDHYNDLYVDEGEVSACAKYELTISNALAGKFILNIADPRGK